MAKLVTPYTYPRNLASNRFALNGKVPSAMGMRSAALGLNFVAQRLRKQVVCHSYEYPAVPAGASGTTSNCVFLFRSGINTSELRCILGIGPAQNAAATDPRIRLALNDVSGATTTYSEYVRFNEIPAEETLYRLVPELTDYTRLISLTAYERAPSLADTSNDGVCDPTQFAAYADITDGSVQGVLEAATALWQKNGAILISFSRFDETSAPSLNTTTYTNILDGTTSVASTSRGWVIDNQYHNTRGQTTVPVELAIDATRTGGAGALSVRLISADGVELEQTGITHGSGTVRATYALSMDANTGAKKYDVQAQCSNGTTTWRIDSLALWEYEA